MNGSGQPFLLQYLPYLRSKNGWTAIHSVTLCIIHDTLQGRWVLLLSWHVHADEQGQEAVDAEQLSNHAGKGQLTLFLYVIGFARWKSREKGRL